MSQLTFKYLPHPKKDPKTKKIIGEVYHPFIPVRICYKHQFLKNPINSLVDSGSERNLFPAYFGEKLKIKIKKGKPRDVYGIGGIKIKAYTHEMKLFIGMRSIKTQIDFSYEQEVPLLGRIGFFDKFKSVTFKEKERIVEIEL